MGIAYLLGKKNIKRIPELNEDGLIYGVRIGTNNSNPTTAVTYIEDSVGFTPARGNNGSFDYGSWENRFPFNAIRPCLMKDGIVVGYLKKTDYRQFEDGTPSNINTATSGDVMIEFPIIYYKIQRGTQEIRVTYSKTQIDETYKPLAHIDSNQQIKNKLYIGAFVSSTYNSRLYSISGANPTTTTNLANFRTLATAKGSGYALWSHNQVTMLQVLFITMFKSRDSVEILGAGKTTSGVIATGETVDKGMFYGVADSSKQIKFCGIESFYGNVFQIVDGIMYDSDKNININGVNYGYQDSLTGLVTDIQGTTEKGFIPRNSDTIANVSGMYYLSNATLTAGRVFQFGSGASNPSHSGAFRYTADVLPNATANNRGARLIYL